MDQESCKWQIEKLLGLLDKIIVLLWIICILLANITIAMLVHVY